MIIFCLVIVICAILIITEQVGKYWYYWLGGLGFLGFALGLTQLPRKRGFIIMTLGGLLIAIYSFVLQIWVFVLFNVIFIIINIFEIRKR